MELNPADLMTHLQSLQDQHAVIQEAVMQLLEQLVKPLPAESQRFELGMRQRPEAIFQGQTHVPSARSDEEMTLLLAALLASAGRPPKTR